MYYLFKSLLLTSSYLSLVILSVEEVCIPGQVYHCSDVILGLVNDGQVEQPTERQRELMYRQIFNEWGTSSMRQHSVTHLCGLINIPLTVF